MKKNTLLYLDEGIVKAAKKKNLNLSRIAENAIETELFPILSRGEEALFDFDWYLEKMAENGYCFFLPFKIGSVSVKNIGPLIDFKTDFSDFNVIVGRGGDGKSILLRTIAFMLGQNEELDTDRLVNHLSDSGSVTFNIVGDRNINLSIKKGEDALLDVGCILIDSDVYTRLDEPTLEKFFKHLKKLMKKRNCQIILASTQKLGLKGVRVIKLPDTFIDIAVAKLESKRESLLVELGRIHALREKNPRDKKLTEIETDLQIMLKLNSDNLRELGTKRQQKV